MDIQEILTEIEQDEEAFAKKHGGTTAPIEPLHTVSYVFTDKGEPRVQISLGKHVVVIRDSVGNVVRLVGQVDKTN